MELFSALGSGIFVTVVTYIVPFLFVLTMVVFVHELGHFLVGRWCGVEVKTFSIGFGPELFGFNDRHGTRWRFALGWGCWRRKSLAHLSKSPRADRLVPSTSGEGGRLTGFFCARSEDLGRADGAGLPAGSGRIVRCTESHDGRSGVSPTMRPVPAGDDHGHAVGSVLPLRQG